MSAVRVMAARFGSTCSCGGPIRAGDQIRYVAGMVATHEGCGDPVVAAERSGAPRRARSGRASSGARVWSRCTHEDYPCCGCGS